MMMTLSKIDFDKLPEDDTEIETIVNSLDGEETIALINAARQRQMEPTFQADEREVRLYIMLTRRMRALRETKTRTSASQKANAKPVSAPTLDDI